MQGRASGATRVHPARSTYSAWRKDRYSNFASAKPGREAPRSNLVQPVYGKNPSSRVSPILAGGPRGIATLSRWPDNAGLRDALAESR